jgi:hypothetical protein
MLANVYPPSHRLIGINLCLITESLAMVRHKSTKQPYWVLLVTGEQTPHEARLRL